MGFTEAEGRLGDPSGRAGSATSQLCVEFMSPLWVSVSSSGFDKFSRTFVALILGQMQHACPGASLVVTWVGWSWGGFPRWMSDFGVMWGRGAG